MTLSSIEIEYFKILFYRFDKYSNIICMYLYLEISVIIRPMAKSIWYFHKKANKYSVQFSSVAQLCPTRSDPMDCSLPAPPSMGFSRQEYWSGLPLSSPQWGVRFWSLSSPSINFMDYGYKMLQHVSSLISKNNHFSCIVAKTVLLNFGKKKNHKGDS